MYDKYTAFGLNSRRIFMHDWPEEFLDVHMRAIIRNERAKDGLPPELRFVREETIVVGEIDDLIAYVERGQAEREWHERVAVLAEELDAFLREHRYVWSHIIIPDPKGSE